MNYGKAIAALVATILSALVVALLGDAVITTIEWVNVAIAGTGAAAVFAAPNVPGAKYTKSTLAVLTAVLVLLTSVISGGISTTEWLQLALAALGALGVYAAKYAPLASSGEVIGRFPKS
jgi:2-keto-3-deoxy-6-phosphogluconate aldolase